MTVTNVQINHHVQISNKTKKSHESDDIHGGDDVVESASALLWYKEISTLFSITDSSVDIMPRYVDLLRNLLKPVWPDLDKVRPYR